ncbi:MAG: adenylosuccinate synthase [Synergistaceae bacterium]|jgi:adenylosuccinate synthase|nr:adenylosuccinate synthase [Synergistaceae bacterium]
MKNDVQALIGAQWGDEGKGRVVDVLAREADVVVRYQGGANAGHTVIVGGKKHVFHLLPSGMLYPNRLCVVGNGVVLDPEQFISEVNGLDPAPEKIGTRLVVSGGAHVVMPYHKRLDVLSEQARAAKPHGSAIGTTGRGIGSCYVDKYNRIGIRVEDLVRPEILENKLRMNVEEKSLILEKIYGEPGLNFGELYEKALGWGRFMAPYIGDSSIEIDSAAKNGKKILFEGAQGTLLDVDHGTYPFVTSSSCVSGGCCTGGTLSPGRFDRVIGVVKAYCTRVGEGPFPTEDHGVIGERLREKGDEYGVTTGRPRRCGWLDIVALNYAARINGLGVIALTKLDVLSGFDELKVCTEYETDGRRSDVFPNSAYVLEGVAPVYESFPSWREDISKCRTFDELPAAARDYIGFIEKSTGVPVGLIGVGPGREDTIFRNF